MNSKIETVVDILADLNYKVTLDEKLSYVSDDEFDRIYEQVNNLRINIYNHKEVSSPSRDRLEELTDIMTMIPQFDFSQKAYVSDEENHLDYLAIGLNLLSHQLEKRITPLLNYEKVFNNIKDMAIITDPNGSVKYINPAASSFLKYNDQEIAGKNISSFLLHQDILDFVSAEREVEIEIKNKENEVLHVSMSISTITDENGLNEGNIFLGRIQKVRSKLIEDKDTANVKIEKINLDSLLKSIMKEISLYPNYLFLNFHVNVNQKGDFYSHVSHVETIIKNMFIYSLLLRKGTDYIFEKPRPLFELTVEDCDNGIMLGVYDNGIGINVEGKPAILLDGLCKTTIAEDKDLALYIVKESVKIVNGVFGVEMRYNIFLPNLGN